MRKRTWVSAPQEPSPHAVAKQSRQGEEHHFHPIVCILVEVPFEFEALEGQSSQGQRGRQPKRLKHENPFEDARRDLFQTMGG